MMTLNRWGNLPGRENANPRTAPKEIFWKDRREAEHAVQLYSDVGLFLDALEGFVSGGLRAGEGVIVIASGPHLRALERRLQVRGYDLERARADDRYLTQEAESALSQFVARGCLDEVRFRQFTAPLLARARGRGRPVRVFGEMVVVLWTQGLAEATLQLEKLWTELCQAEGFRLFCAYPLGIFSPEAEAAIGEICAHHSRLIPE
jgi:hypothetical protein